MAILRAQRGELDLTYLRHWAEALHVSEALATPSATATTTKRIEAVAEGGGTLRVLDLTAASVRTSIAAAPDAETLYAGPLAADY